MSGVLSMTEILAAQLNSALSDISKSNSICRCYTINDIFKMQEHDIVRVPLNYYKLYRDVYSLGTHNHKETNICWFQIDVFGIGFMSQLSA